MIDEEGGKSTKDGREMRGTAGRVYWTRDHKRRNDASGSDAAQPESDSSTKERARTHAHSLFIRSHQQELITPLRFYASDGFFDDGEGDGRGWECKRAALVEEAPHRGRHPSTTPSAFWHRRSPPISGGRRANNSEERAKKPMVYQFRIGWRATFAFC